MLEWVGVRRPILRMGECDLRLVPADDRLKPQDSGRIRSKMVNKLTSLVGAEERIVVGVASRSESRRSFRLEKFRQVNG
jgi:hypothetical protein